MTNVIIQKKYYQLLEYHVCLE